MTEIIARTRAVRHFVSGKWQYFLYRLAGGLHRTTGHWLMAATYHWTLHQIRQTPTFKPYISHEIRPVMPINEYFEPALDDRNDRSWED